MLGGWGRGRSSQAGGGGDESALSLCDALASESPTLVEELLRMGARPRTVLEGAVHVCADCPGGLCPGPLHRCWQRLSDALTAQQAGSAGSAGDDPGDGPAGDDPAPLQQAFAGLVQAGASLDTPSADSDASVASLVESFATQQVDAAASIVALIEELRTAAEQAGHKLLTAAEQNDKVRLAQLLWDQQEAGAASLGATRADVSFRDGAGLTALHWALVRGNARAVRILLRNGADLQLQDNWGLAPLHAPFAPAAAVAAAARGARAGDRGMHPLAHEPKLEPMRLHSVLEILTQELSTSVDTLDEFGGGTLLHYAVQDGVPETVQGLRWNGASSTVQDVQGKTAIERAVREPEMLSALDDEPRLVTEPPRPDGSFEDDETEQTEHSQRRCVSFPRPQVRVADEKEPASGGDETGSKAVDSARNALFGGASQSAPPPIDDTASSNTSEEEEEADDGSGSDIFDGLDGVTGLPWDDLAGEQQAAARILGWDGESQWVDQAQVSIRVLDKEFHQLSAEEQNACEELEINEDDWDDMELLRSPQQPAHSQPEPEPEPEPELEPARGTAPAGEAPDLRGRGGARLLSSVALAQYRAHAVDEVCSLLNASQHVAVGLLSQHDWDVGVIRSVCADQWFGDGRADLLTAIGISPGEAEQEEAAAGQMVPQGEESQDDEVECMVCFDDVPSSEASRSRCGHIFCNGCWAMHLNDRIAEGELRVACMDTTCKVSVTESFVRRLASEASVAKFERFSLAKMIEEHRTGMLKKCRNPGCEMTIRLTRPEVGCLEVLCDSSLGGCGCLNCAVPGCWEEAHFPLDCKRVPDWQRKCNEDGGLSGWIKAGLAAAGEGQNTDGVKACPKCGVYIEKNGACPYMRCGGHAHTSNMEAVSAGVACGCEFCWVCMEILEPGKGHMCNAYNQKQQKGSGRDGGGSDSKEKQRQQKEDEIKYLSHYYERYEHHHGSRKYIERDRAQQQKNHDTLSADSTLAVAVDPKYLFEACELLIDARQDLKWSYAAAYFLKPSPQKDFFEFLQGDLEQDVELLARLLEHSVPGHQGAGAGYEERAVHKTQVLSRMNGVQLKLDNLEFHAARGAGDDGSGAGSSRAQSGGGGDADDGWLARRRRRARKGNAGGGAAVRTSNLRLAEEEDEDTPVDEIALPAGRGGKIACGQCTYENEAGTTTCTMCSLPLTPQAAAGAVAAVCPEFATPCRDGAACAKRGDATHMMAYWHPPAE